MRRVADVNIELDNKLKSSKWLILRSTYFYFNFTLFKIRS